MEHHEARYTAYTYNAATRRYAQLHPTIWLTCHSAGKVTSSTDLAEAAIPGQPLLGRGCRRELELARDQRRPYHQQQQQQHWQTAAHRGSSLPPPVTTGHTLTRTTHKHREDGDEQSRRRCRPLQVSGRCQIPDDTVTAETRTLPPAQRDVFHSRVTQRHSASLTSPRPSVTLGTGVRLQQATPAAGYTAVASLTLCGGYHPHPARPEVEQAVIIASANRVRAAISRSLNGFGSVDILVTSL